jgi:biotin carboxylase
MPRKQQRVWFSRGLSNVYDAIRLAREHDAARRVRLLASDVGRDTPALALADERFDEPRRTVSDDEFIAWALSECRTRGVDLFVPGRRAAAVAAARPEFEAAGTRVLVAATPQVYSLVHRKDRVYEALAGEEIALPDWRVVRTADEFDQACAELGREHQRLCIKPAASMFGLGFHTLAEADDPYARMLGQNPTPLSRDACRRLIAEARSPRPLLVMEYLPGPERSVDCLAREGRLIVAISRRKHASYQILETEGPAIEAARAVVKRLQLHGVVNVQTRDTRKRPYLLEVNARMAGGILYSALSGTALPWWSIALELGLAREEEIPAPRAGLKVAPITGAVVLGTDGEDSKATPRPRSDSPALRLRVP